MKTIDEILNKYSRTDEGDGFYAEDVYKAMEEYASLKVAESKQLPLSEQTPDGWIYDGIVFKKLEYADADIKSKAKAFYFSPQPIKP